MRLLALDTATLEASVAVLEDAPGGVRLLAERARRVTTHSESLLALVSEALEGAGLAARDLDAIACGAGPGSFTGLRIGLATAKGLCFALGRPLVMVSSLAALAARARPGAIICASLDAYQGEVYAGRYRVETPEAVTVLAPEVAVAPAALAAELAGLGPHLLVGDGALKHEALRAAGGLLDGHGGPRALEVGRLALPRLRLGKHDPLDAVPHYLRASEAERARRRS